MNNKENTYQFIHIKEFDWDEGNFEKNELKHNVKWLECEQIFFNKPLFFFKDTIHSISEDRYYAYGKTDSERFLTIVFTIRVNKIRVISARDMSKKERNYYEKSKKT